MQRLHLDVSFVESGKTGYKSTGGRRERYQDTGARVRVLTDRPMHLAVGCGRIMREWSFQRQGRVLTGPRIVSNGLHPPGSSRNFRPAKGQTESRQGTGMPAHMHHGQRIDFVAYGTLIFARRDSSLERCGASHSPGTSCCSCSHCACLRPGRSKREMASDGYRALQIHS